jgi:hypothetical protein
MTTFTDAVRNQGARTTNGMVARESTSNSLVDLFYKIGSARQTDIIPSFVAAYAEDPYLAVRIALWARDARGGAGERKTFRSILEHMDKYQPEEVREFLHIVPELGRWDDLLVVENTKDLAYDLIFKALAAGNGLCAKWMPRKGEKAVELRNAFGMTPKQYRKILVGLSNTVEQKMCAQEWSEINFNHVPSVAANRYQKAFTKHDPLRYSQWKSDLKTGENGAKVNASVLYPYEVIRALERGDAQVALAQWEALPNFLGDGAPILPIVDVSGSMTCQASPGVSCLDVAVSLGLYLADKNLGPFKDTFLTFSGTPQLLHLKGDLIAKLIQMKRSKWEMNTDLVKGVKLILDVAVAAGVPQEEMPEALLVLSDMQFDACARYDDSAIQMIERKYKEAGYKMPRIVFWNLNARYANVPTSANHPGVGLVSGFSPSIMKSVLEGGDFTPYGIMMQTIMNERYDF